MAFVELVDNMTREQIRDYWYELKQCRYDQHYYRAMYDHILRMNPNLVMPDPGVIHRLEKEALGIAFWEENWEITNQRRVRNGGQDYSLFQQVTGKRRNDFSLETNFEQIRKEVRVTSI